MGVFVQTLITHLKRLILFGYDSLVNGWLKNQKVVNKNLQKPSGKVNIKGNRQKKLKKTINRKVFRLIIYIFTVW